MVSFVVLGVEGAVETITTHTTENKHIYVAISSNSTGDITHGANKCTTFHLSPEVLSGECFTSLYREGDSKLLLNLYGDFRNS